MQNHHKKVFPPPPPIPSDENEYIEMTSNTSLTYSHIVHSSPNETTQLLQQPNTDNNSVVYSHIKNSSPTERIGLLDKQKENGLRSSGGNRSPIDYSLHHRPSFNSNSIRRTKLSGIKESETNESENENTICTNVNSVESFNRDKDTVKEQKSSSISPEKTVDNSLQRDSRLCYVSDYGSEQVHV